MDNANDSEDDWEADNESDIAQDNVSEDWETPEQRNVSAAPNVSGFIRPIRWSKKKAEIVLMTVNILETRRIEGIKKKSNRMRQCIITKFIMYFDRELHLEKYHGRILSIRVRIVANKPTYSGKYGLFGKIYNF